ncbi:hypothetical protein PF008_g29033 [Phytophthora fragariae]|uniref:Pectate lyase n=1 Tax=Phytophthora fragariae TaxID=53985 RepID=A0A6G0Q9M8_9STRA|nr:hypothetical protein PF008_g29033 [Phytophthora fragariae]
MMILLVALALLLSAKVDATGEHGHFRGGDSMALVISANTQEEVNEACDASNGQGCLRHLIERDEGQYESYNDFPPEFVPTNDWQDILPNQAVPPGLYIRVNLATGKKEAKLLQ